MCTHVPFITAIVSCHFVLVFHIGLVVSLSTHGCLPNGVLVTRVARMLIDSATVVGHGRAGTLP